MGDPPFLYVQPTPRRLLSPPPLPSSAASNSNLPMLYYGIFVVGTAIIVLAVYNLIIIKYCSDHPHDGPSRRQEPTSTRSIIGLRASSITSFKYSKKGPEQDKDQGNNDNECVVCLSVFEEGEEIRKLIGCKHSFHAACIDMWLHSHSECPLCRSPVERPAVIDSQSENSREGLIHEGIV